MIGVYCLKLFWRQSCLNAQLQIVQSKISHCLSNVASDQVLYFLSYKQVDYRGIGK